MTNKEAIIASLQITGYSDSAIEKALLDSGLNGGDSYETINAKSIDLAAIDVLQGMLSVSSVSEGGYSVSYSTAGIKARLEYLSAKNGLLGAVPTVTSKSVW